jgi:hypothetical protein
MNNCTAFDHPEAIVKVSVKHKCPHVPPGVRTLNPSGLIATIAFADWQIFSQVITFILLPATISICRVYGSYYRQV